MSTIQFDKYIRDIPDFPKPGIIFKDITPLLMNPEVLDASLNALTEPFKGLGISKVVGVEARGFIFAPSIAISLDAGFVPVRKPGKLPYDTEAHTYDLEYGTDTIEIHKDAIKPGEKVLIVDDLLATGGTVDAACKLVKKLGGEVAGVAFLIELGFLEGRKKFDGYTVHSLLKY